MITVIVYDDNNSLEAKRPWLGTVHNANIALWKFQNVDMDCLVNDVHKMLFEKEYL